MTFRWWERWSPTLGILAVVLWIVAFAVGGSSPSTDDSDAKITSWYMSHSHQTRQIVGFFIFLAGILLFLGFLGALRARLAAAEGEPGRLRELAFGAGIASAVLLTVAFSIFTAPAFLTNDTSVRSLDPNTFRLANDLGYEIWVASVVVGAVLVWATSALALRTDVLPRWFAWVGVVVGVVLLFALFFIPVFVYWGWIVVAAALFTWRAAAEPKSAAPAP
jgi:hypothetical protein